MDHGRSLWAVEHHELKQVASAIWSEDQVAHRIVTHFFDHEGMAKHVLDVFGGDAVPPAEGRTSTSSNRTTKLPLDNRRAWLGGLVGFPELSALAAKIALIPTEEGGVLNNRELASVILVGGFVLVMCVKIDVRSSVGRLLRSIVASRLMIIWLVYAAAVGGRGLRRIQNRCAL